MFVVKPSFRNNSALGYPKDTYQRCQNALVRAAGYLVEKSCLGGGWSDFQTNSSGESTSWVTAYVLWQIGDLLPQTITKKSLQALLSQRQNYGGWGFSQFVPPDCDSTLHALNAIFRLGVRRIKNVLESIEFVLSHQSRRGGFSTYKDTISLRRYRGTHNDFNYDGWIQPHVCVTATALETLLHFPSFVPNCILTSIASFLLETQTSKGYWESYWWRSKYFATTRIIQQFNFINNAQLKEGIFRALNWLVKSVNVDGYWDNGYDASIPCPLSTANCINALLATDVEQKLVFKSVSWLLEQQDSDGSWQGIPALQIPPSHIKNPADVSVWRVGGRGVGSCCLDKKRIYTTSTVASAIHKFILRVENGI